MSILQGGYKKSESYYVKPVSKLDYVGNIQLFEKYGVILHVLNFATACGC